MSVSIGNDLLYNQSVNSSNTLDNTLKKDYKNSTDNEIMDVCKEFEAYFLEQLFKGMKKTIIKAEEKQNQYLEYFEDMQYQQYAKDAADTNGIGLAQMLYESMKRV